MSQYFTPISCYFRQSLIDVDRLCPADKDILPVLGPDKSQVTNVFGSNAAGSSSGMLRQRIAQVIEKENKEELEGIC